MNRLTAILGILAVAVFGTLIAVFSHLNQNVDPIRDSISLLGATNQPFAI